MYFDHFDHFDHKITVLEKHFKILILQHFQPSEFLHFLDKSKSAPKINSFFHILVGYF